MTTTTDLTSTARIESTIQSLELQSLDTDSLFSALSSVEKAIPVLLSCIKPILAHLSSPNPNPSSSSGEEEEELSGEAKDAIRHYMDLLDKIQFVLRQTVYYLHETKASSNTLRPPHPNSIPTPFASTLPDISAFGTSTDMNSDTRIKSGEVELGLYGKRIEARTLREMIDVLGKVEGVVPAHLVRRGDEQGGVGADREHEGMDVDATPREDVRI